MKSPMHRAVILTRAFRDIGLGAAMAADGFRKCTGAVWFFTLDLGRRAGSASGGREALSGGARKRPFCVEGPVAAGGAGAAVRPPAAGVG